MDTVSYQRFDYDEVDYRAVVAINRNIDPNHVEADTELREYDEAARASGRISARVLAVVEDAVVGFAHVTVTPYQPPERILHRIMVHRDAQGQGIGRALLDQAESIARAAGRSVVTTVTSDRYPAAVSLLDSSGYREVDRRWESVLDLTSWHPRDAMGILDA